MRRQLITTIISFVFLNGCTTLGVPVTKFQASNYSTVEDFIKNNFKSSLDVFDGLFKKEEIASTGAKWKATFNGLNDSYLHKPSGDLQTFCEAKGGSFAQIGPDDALQISKINNKQIDAHGLANNVMIDLTQKYNWKEYPASLAASDTLQWAESRNSYNNDKANSLYSSLKQAEKDGYLGLYACTKNNAPEWLASISLLEAKSEQNTMNMLKSNSTAILMIEGKTL